jgi:hypothetical protein
MLLIIFLTWQQRSFFKKQMEQQDKKIREQAELIESARKSNMVYLMSNVLADVKEELKKSDTLSDDAGCKSSSAQLFLQARTGASKGIPYQEKSLARKEDSC